MDEKKRSLWPGWETVGLIGRGSFGEVYRIQRDLFGEMEYAALKVISIPQNAGDIDELYNDGYDEESITSTFRSHLKSIVAEYSLMRKMSGCPNIVNCDDLRYVQHDDGIGWDIFIKMELLTPLAKALPSQIPEETVITVAKDMCAALEMCKKHGVIHRDIKPQNIFLSPDGYYKLGDFGIAKTVEKTMGGTKIGTYKYMAPEVYHSQPYGTAADIYSLGLVLYWMLNERRMPFLPLPPEKLKAGIEEESRHRRLSGEPLPPPAHGSEKLKRIVLKACAYDPAHRYRSASDLLQDLIQAPIAEQSVRKTENITPEPTGKEKLCNPKEAESEKAMPLPTDNQIHPAEFENALSENQKTDRKKEEAWAILLGERDHTARTHPTKQAGVTSESKSHKPLSKKDEAWAILLGDKESSLGSQPAEQKAPNPEPRRVKSILHSVKTAVQEWYALEPEKRTATSATQSSSTSTTQRDGENKEKWDGITRLYRERDEIESREKQWEMHAYLQKNEQTKE